MDAEVAAQIGAQRGERNPDRVTHRNGYPNRPWDTRVGTTALRIPKIRKGSYFQSLLEAGRRSQKALLGVVQQACVEAVSTRRVDRYGLRWHIKSQVSRICRDLYQVVENFRPDPWTAVLIPMCGWTRDLRSLEKVVALLTSARCWLPTLLGNGAALPTYNSHPRMCKPTPTRCWPSSESAFPRPLR